MHPAQTNKLLSFHSKLSQSFDELSSGSILPFNWYFVCFKKRIVSFLIVLYGNLLRVAFECNLTCENIHTINLTAKNTNTSNERHGRLFVAIKNDAMGIWLVTNRRDLFDALKRFPYCEKWKTTVVCPTRTFDSNQIGIDKYPVEMFCQLHRQMSVNQNVWLFLETNWWTADAVNIKLIRGSWKAENRCERKNSTVFKNASRKRGIKGGAQEKSEPF